MDKFILPPSPNWFLSRILSCNDDGIIAYGSKTELSIIKLKSEGQFDVSLIYFAHKEKVNVVVFSPKNGRFNNCLATCGDDGIVRVWDFENSTLLLCHSGHKDGVKVKGLDWSRIDTNRLVSVNDFGSVVVWDIASNTIRRLHCGAKVLPLCLSCCPHDKDLIAIGCKAGITLVLDIKGNGKLIHRLRSHDQDIASISWCPVPFNVINHKRTNALISGKETKEENTDKPKDLLLATGGYDQSIFIWRAGSDGRYEAVLQSSYSGVSKDVSRRKVLPQTSTSFQWTCVLWVDAYTLLSSNYSGHLLSWNLANLYPNDKNKKLQPRLLHSKHYKSCFSIACPIIYDRVEEWKLDNRIVWTTAMDNSVIGCSLTSSNILLDIPTLGGAVYCMALSPLDPSRLAVGCSDSRILIWNISDFSKINVTCYSRKIMGKVMALSWHPTEENRLAFGTSDGHVGLLDVGYKKVPTLLRLHHRKAVYRLCWAPPLNTTGQDLEKAVLYSVGDGDVLQYTANLDQPDEGNIKEPIVLQEPKSLNLEVLNDIDTSQGVQKHLVRSDLVFKHDLSCFVAASDNGSVYVVGCHTLTLQHVIFAHKKLINSLEWHPETVTSDNNISLNKDWLATASDNIKVYNISLDSPPELVANLTGHLAKIVCLAWSPHFNGRLMSSSYDSTVQLWDVPKQTCVGIYQAHNSAVLSSVFSPLDLDLVISGSIDSTLRVWSLSELSTNSDLPYTRKQLRRTKNQERSDVGEAREIIDAKPAAVLDCESSTNMKASKKERKDMSPDTCETGSKDPTKGLEDNKKRLGKQSFFFMTGPKLLQAPHFDVLLEQFMSSDPLNTSYSTVEGENSASTSQLGYLDFFRDSNAMRRILCAEENALMDMKNFPLACNAALWRGDVSSMIQEAITKKQLSPWLISMAPIAGFDVWEQACDAYANQLVEQGDFLRASTYLLATHKVHEAVKLLIDSEVYRDAAAIAKCRLPADDPLIIEVYRKWAEWAGNRGLLSLAAHCYLAANDTEACIATLVRIKDLKSLKMAASLAKHIGQADLSNRLALECLTLCVKACNFTVGQKLLLEIPQYQYWAVWLKASQVLARVKNHTEVEVFGWLEGHRPVKSSLCHDLTATCSPQGNIYQQLLPHLPTNKAPDFDRDMWFYVSGHLAVACAAKLESSIANFLRHMVSAFSTAFHFQTTHPESLALPIIISQIFPMGLFAEGSILLANYETNEDKLLVKSLKAFVCASFIHWMNNNWEKVENLHSEEETNIERGGEDCCKLERDFKMGWLVELFVNCTADVLDPESVSFFVKKAQKLQLENLLMEENIREKSLRCQNSKQKDLKSKKKTFQSNNEDFKDLEHSNALDNVTKQTKGDKEVDKDLNVTPKGLEALVKTGVKCTTVETDVMKKTDPNGAVVACVFETAKKVGKTTYEVEPSTPSFDQCIVKSEEADTQKGTDQNVTVVFSAPKADEVELSIQPTVLSIETFGKSEKKSNLKASIDSFESRENSCLTLKSDKQNSISNLKEINPCVLKADNVIEEVSTKHISKKNESAILNSKTDEIKVLDNFLSAFESKRVSAPSPFTAYINIKYLIDNIVNKQDAKLAQNLQENCDCLWKKSHQ